MGKKIVFVLWIIALLAIVGICGVYAYTTYMRMNDTPDHPEVTFEIENYGNVKMELYPEYAPNTVANIIKLVEKGFYNNKVLYGKDDYCMYIGRDANGEVVNPKASLIDDTIEADAADNPIDVQIAENEAAKTEESSNTESNADEKKDYEYTIKGEFVGNGFKGNTLRHEKGIVTLLRNDYTQYFANLMEESYNSGNAQLAIITADEANTLNGAYTAFGKITEGLDIIEKINNESEIKEPEVNAETGEKIETGIDVFKIFPVIKSATVDTKGVDYGMPEIQEAFDYDSYINQMMSSYYGTK